jgi:putative restriction endonuclease
LSETLSIDVIEGDTLFSKHLIPGKMYTREHLLGILASQDRTIFTGIFKPKGWNSILIFATQKPAKDRTQFANRLNEYTLHWQSQTKGRKDRQIIEHLQDGVELLVFYREETKQFPGGAFVYEGQFEYVSHTGREPADFILRRSELLIPNQGLIENESFNPANESDARRRIMREISVRQGQPAFRNALLKAYQGRCAISGCAVTTVLEAAHIMPYKGEHTNHVSNGLLLRADLHTLFDCDMIAISEDYRVIVAHALHGTEYVTLEGKALQLPAIAAHRPNSDALKYRREKAGLMHFV